MSLSIEGPKVTTARPERPQRRSPAGAARLRVAINLLTEDPASPSGAHWFWTRVIPEMAARLGPNEELHLVVSPKCRPLYQGYGPQVHYITFPWSNEQRNLRTLSEHLYTPLRLPLANIDVFNTLMAPIFNPTWSLVVHMKTMHAFTTPEALSPGARLYRRLSYPRSARLAKAIIINSETLRDEIERYLEVDPAKLRLVHEAVDHDLFKPGDAGGARAHVANRYGVTKPFVLFVSSLWPYKNCAGLLRAWALAEKDLLGYQLAVVGGGRDEKHIAELHSLARELGITQTTVFVGPVPLEETVRFYQGAEALVYPSLSETFGLPILEAMACGCPVVTSNLSAMPETAGGAALLADPSDPASMASAIKEAIGPRREWLREQGLRRAAQFTWASTGAKTLEVYREAGERRRSEQRAGPWSVGKLAPTSHEPSNAPSGCTSSVREPQSLSRPTMSTTETPKTLTEREISSFWESHPCGDRLLGGLDEKFRGEYEAFFTAYDKKRYNLESHIPRCLDGLDVRGKRLLEIGLGQGAESEGLIRRGAKWTGLDLTDESVRRVSTRLQMRALPYEAILHGSATSIPARDASFDMVFSHGVLHHVPDISAAQAEIHRVLKPRGRLVAMLYARNSLNYIVSIAVVRRAALLAAWPLRAKITKGHLGTYLRYAEKEGLFEYLALRRFVHASTDGPENPFSRVYDLGSVRRDFPSFRLVRAHKEFLHAPPLPVHGLPGASLIGWHLWVELEAL